MDISKYIDYTLLNPTSTERNIIDLCHVAKKNGFYSVCVSSSYVSLAKQLLEKTNVKICSVIGFPLGSMATASKVYEAKQAVSDGADEIDMVINLGFLKSKNYVSVFKDISDVKLAIGGKPLKVIVEVSELNKNEIIKACEISLDANVDYIKTSSGFSKGGATLTVVKIIKKTVKNRIKICASGDIKDVETAKKYIDIGVSRINVSSDFKIKQTA
ncbi:deoxyribose-phosphate aldolase [Flavivirga rizhaonensis]|uniref:Deoxyribose-phosphate aldolase n=1 Tax=Flavivirga rizhaonensis TaxID=2559571 RepID=A0A4S1DUB9_9FLAO|nr:deoxyribose-phosphate aldolase [Flavivirga rizhaonensis]TGV01433.1 deoxyribose-phosphate aldolase [Flavivirga rizhaonensis]